MTYEELLGKLWELVETWGPLAIGAAAIAGIITFALVVGVFVFVFRQFRQFDREWNATTSRMRGRR